MKLVIEEIDYGNNTRDQVIEKTKKMGSVVEIFVYRGTLVIAIDDSKELLKK